MSLLHQVESGAQLRPRRILLYGQRGIGLSTFATALTAPIFVPADESLMHLDCRRFPAPERFGHLLKALQELHNEPHSYRTVVVDPLDGLERLIHEGVRCDSGVEHVEALPFATGAKLALAYWNELLAALDALRDDIGMTCVLIGHTRAKRIADKPGAAAPLIVERRVPALEARASSLVQSWCDEVLLADWRGDRTESASNKQADQRRLYTTPARIHAAKNRLGLPSELPMDAPGFAQRIAVPKHPMCSNN